MLKIIGGGLAGCEAAWQAANRGIKVKLYEMKPQKFSPAHTNENLCELVCSNSLKGAGLDNACGLLKEEMRHAGSLVISCSDKTRVPAGGALAVDRDEFSRLVTKEIKNHPNIEIINEPVSKINDDEYTIIATGPLTDSSLTDEILRLTGEDSLYFFDAAAPVITTESINQDITYMAARYNKGTPDYINCPMEKDEYDAFYDALINAERASLHEKAEDIKVFEGCMPVEIMAARGRETLLFGPLKPKGLINPKTGKEPHAVLQLRRDNAEGTLYNLVGFQTNLKFGEQKRVFSMIPGLENAEFMRYGVMHRNTFINSPLVLNDDYSLIKYPRIYFAGQITGVEGYVESASSGMVAGINAARAISGKEPVKFPSSTCTGALINYITNRENKKFQPMNANFGIIEWERVKIKNKKERYEYISSLALSAFDSICDEFKVNG